jgi:uncharacterized membrane protein
MTTPGSSGSDFPGGTSASGGPLRGSPLDSVSRAISSPRALAAWVLVTYMALKLFFEFFRWILPNGTFTGRSAMADFHNIVFIPIPLVAVLLASHVTPAIARARTIAAAALIEYGVALFFGFVTLLTGLGGVFDAVHTANEGFEALRYLVMGTVELVLLAIAGAAVLRTYLNLGGRLH